MLVGAGAGAGAEAGCASLGGRRIQGVQRGIDGSSLKCWTLVLSALECLQERIASPSAHDADEPAELLVYTMQNSN